MSGSAATFTVYDFIRENLQKWRLPEALYEKRDEENEEGKNQDESKQSQLSKAQKRKQYRFMDANGEKQRGWNWIDIISHVRPMQLSKA